MPRRSVHLAAGVLCGAGLALLTTGGLPDRDRVPELLGAGLAGALGGLLPDILEPASAGPHHRALAHSLVAAFGLSRVDWLGQVRALRAQADQLHAAAAADGCPVAERDRLIGRAWCTHLAAGLLLGAVAGYGSHLALDAGTPKGLPMLGR